MSDTKAFDDELRQYRDAVIQADKERCAQAYAIAAAELGHPPCQDTQPADFLGYCDDLNQLASEKFARLI